jgi:hypothetical protein
MKREENIKYQNSEIWKFVPNTNHEISSFGRFRNRTTRRILKGQYNDWGYKRYRTTVNYKKFNVSEHRMVAEAFIPNPENKPTVNHINGIKDDNRIENLEWATQSENNRHAYRTGLHPIHIKRGKLAPEDVISMRIIDEMGVPRKSIAKLFDVHWTQAYKIMDRLRWQSI